MFKPVEQEAQKLRQYDELTVLSAVSRISIARARNDLTFEKICKAQNVDPRTKLRDYQLAFAAKLALHFYGKPRLSPKIFQMRNLVEACDVPIKYQEPSYYPLENWTDAEKLFIRLAYQQFPDFYSEGITFGRTHLLFHTCAEEVQKRTGFDLDKEYETITGLTLDKCWVITLAICGTLLSQGHGMFGPLTAGDLSGHISNADIIRYLRLVSLRPEEYAEKMKLPQHKLDPCETFNPIPLVNWPVLELPSNKWLVPVFPYLVRRGTEQMFYDVIASKDREFSGFFGLVFEEYTDRMLSLLDSKYHVIKELPYSVNGKGYQTCDRIVIRNDGSAVLIECKTKRLGLATKLTADENKLRNDVTDINKGGDTGNVVHAIRQLKRTEDAIQAGYPGLEDIKKRITGTMYSLVVTLEPYYHANGGYLKGIIEEELAKGPYPVREYRWQLVDAKGLEMLSALPQGLDFLDFIADKLSATEREVQDMTTFIEYENVGGVQKARQLSANPIIKTEIDHFSSKLHSKTS